MPISGFIFGSRRTRVIPLVFEAFDWTHGVFLGSAMSTETTAAITGQVGVVRRDPMAMLPFCGYNMADYFSHWLGMEPRLKTIPKIFRVNWFRKDDNGKFLWPGYGDNVRILKWIVERIHGNAPAVETPVGSIPAPGSLDLTGSIFRRRSSRSSRGESRRVAAGARGPGRVLRSVRSADSWGDQEGARGDAAAPPDLSRKVRHAGAPIRASERRRAGFERWLAGSQA